MRRSTSGTAGSGLGTTIKYLRSAAGIGLGTTIQLLQRTTSVTATHNERRRGRRPRHRDHVPRIKNAGVVKNWVKAH